MRLQREGQLEQALSEYSEVILAEPDFAEAYYGRASIYYVLGSCDQAINDCNQAIELRHCFVEAYLIRGAAYWGKAAECKADDPALETYCEQVISDCTLVLDYQPRVGMAFFNRGLAYWALRNKPMAKHDLENAAVLLTDLRWREQAESWLAELRRPRLPSQAEPDGWHHICGK